MLTLENIKDILSTVYKKFDGIQLGIAGSYINGTQKADSDLDIVINGDSAHGEVAEYIKSLFNIPVDILWLNLLKQDDEELDDFAIKQGLQPNEFSVYKTVIKEVQWL